jgi:hypothetical protein
MEIYLTEAKELQIVMERIETISGELGDLALSKVDLSDSNGVEIGSITLDSGKAIFTAK